MARLSRLTALALARALLAGPHQAQGLAARMANCLGLGLGPRPWLETLALRLARMPGERWARLEPRSLATLIEKEQAFRDACASEAPPRPQRYLLRPREHKAGAPLGLEACDLPDLPHVGALADWLGLPLGGLWRLSKPRDWQRREPLSAQHYRFQLMAKRSGGWRLLEVPEPHLMGVQRKILRGLLQLLPLHEAAMAYAPGRGVREHAALHAGQAVLLRYDLCDFFAAVQGARLRALFLTLGYPHEVAVSLAALCSVATPEPVLRRMHEAGQLTWSQLQKLRGAHLPQGAPSSATLANLCAFRLDLRLDGLAQALGARYSRYADDLVFSGPQHLRQAQARISAWVGRIALEEGFALNHRKSRCLSAGGRQSVCGVVVNARPNLPRAEFDRLKALLHQCVLHGPASQNREQHADWPAHLRGRVAWAAQLNPAKALRLQALLARVDWAR